MLRTLSRHNTTQEPGDRISPQSRGCDDHYRLGGMLVLPSHVEGLERFRLADRENARAAQQSLTCHCGGPSPGGSAASAAGSPMVSYSVLWQSDVRVVTLVTCLSPAS